jgi:hypothetical protein
MTIITTSLRSPWTISVFKQSSQPSNVKSQRRFVSCSNFFSRVIQSRCRLLFLPAVQRCRVPVIHQLHRGVAVVESKASFYQDPVLRVVVQNLEKTRHIQRRYSEQKNYCFGFFLKDKKRKKSQTSEVERWKIKNRIKSSYEKGEGEKKLKHGKVRKIWV